MKKKKDRTVFSCNKCNVGKSEYPCHIVIPLAPDDAGYPDVCPYGNDEEPNWSMVPVERIADVDIPWYDGGEE